MLRRAVIERLEQEAGVGQLPPGQLPTGGDKAASTLSVRQQRRLAHLLAVKQHGRRSPAEEQELQTILDTAQEGAMRNVLALMQQQAPDSDAYRRALRAYRRSFARFRPKSVPPDPADSSTATGG